MISKTIQLLRSSDWLNVSKEVEIAKGRYQYIDTFSKFKRQLSRVLKSKYYGKKI